MAGPPLFDAVTLRHFGVAGRLDICERRDRQITGPRWCETVRDEIALHAGRGSAECQAVLASGLGPPICPSSGDLREIYRLRTALGGIGRAPNSDAGEAESIFFTAKLDGSFVTDDNAAFEFAVRRLGAGRVFDTIDILRDSVAANDITPSDALSTANDIRAAGRFLRRVHTGMLTTGYFL